MPTHQSQHWKEDATKLENIIPREKQLRNK